MSASTTSAPKGITAHAASAGISVSIGARMKRNLFAPDGMMSSLNMSFTASAIGCSSPTGPTRFGPMRTCMYPITLRSASVRYATQPKSGSAITRISTSVLTKIQTGGPQSGPKTDAE